MRLHLNCFYALMLIIFSSNLLVTITCNGKVQKRAIDLDEIADFADITEQEPEAHSHYDVQKSIAKVRDLNIDIELPEELTPAKPSSSQEPRIERKSDNGRAATTVPSSKPPYLNQAHLDRPNIDQLLNFRMKQHMPIQNKVRLYKRFVNILPVQNGASYLNHLAEATQDVNLKMKNYAATLMVVLTTARSTSGMTPAVGSKLNKLSGLSTVAQVQGHHAVKVDEEDRVTKSVTAVQPPNQEADKMAARKNVQLTSPARISRNTDDDYPLIDADGFFNENMRSKRVMPATASQAGYSTSMTQFADLLRIVPVKISDDNSHDSESETGPKTKQAALSPPPHSSTTHSKSLPLSTKKGPVSKMQPPEPITASVVSLTPTTPGGSTHELTHHSQLATSTATTKLGNPYNWENEVIKELNFKYKKESGPGNPIVLAGDSKAAERPAVAGQKFVIARQEKDTTPRTTLTPTSVTIQTAGGATANVPICKSKECQQMNSNYFVYNDTAGDCNKEDPSGEGGSGGYNIVSNDDQLTSAVSVDKCPIEIPTTTARTTTTKQSACGKIVQPCEGENEEVIEPCEMRLKETQKSSSCKKERKKQHGKPKRPLDKRQILGAIPVNSLLQQPSFVAYPETHAFMPTASVLYMPTMYHQQMSPTPALPSVVSVSTLYSNSLSAPQTERVIKKSADKCGIYGAIENLKVVDQKLADAVDPLHCAQEQLDAMLRESTTPCPEQSTKCGDDNSIFQNLSDCEKSALSRLAIKIIANQKSKRSEIQQPPSVSTPAMAAMQSDQAALREMAKRGIATTTSPFEKDVNDYSDEDRLRRLQRDISVANEIESIVEHIKKRQHNRVKRHFLGHKSKTYAFTESNDDSFDNVGSQSVQNFPTLDDDPKLTRSAIQSRVKNTLAEEQAYDMQRKRTKPKKLWRKLFGLKSTEKHDRFLDQDIQNSQSMHYLEEAGRKRSDRSIHYNPFTLLRHRNQRRSRKHYPKRSVLDKLLGSRTTIESEDYDIPDEEIWTLQFGVNEKETMPVTQSTTRPPPVSILTSSKSTSTPSGTVRTIKPLLDTDFDVDNVATATPSETTQYFILASELSPTSSVDSFTSYYGFGLPTLQETTPAGLQIQNDGLNINQETSATSSIFSSQAATNPLITGIKAYSRPQSAFLGGVKTYSRPSFNSGSQINTQAAPLINEIKTFSPFTFNSSPLPFIQTSSESRTFADEFHSKLQENQKFLEEKYSSTSELEQSIQSSPQQTIANVTTEETFTTVTMPYTTKKRPTPPNSIPTDKETMTPIDQIVFNQTESQLAADGLTSVNATTLYEVTDEYGKVNTILLETVKTIRIDKSSIHLETTTNALNEDELTTAEAMDTGETNEIIPVPVLTTKKTTLSHEDKKEHEKYLSTLSPGPADTEPSSELNVTETKVTTKKHKHHKTKSHHKKMTTVSNENSVTTLETSQSSEKVGQHTNVANVSTSPSEPHIIKIASNITTHLGPIYEAVVTELGFGSLSSQVMKEEGTSSAESTVATSSTESTIAVSTSIIPTRTSSIQPNPTSTDIASTISSVGSTDVTMVSVQEGAVTEFGFEEHWGKNTVGGMTVVENTMSSKTESSPAFLGDITTTIGPLLSGYLVSTISPSVDNQGALPGGVGDATTQVLLSEYLVSKSDGISQSIPTSIIAGFGGPEPTIPFIFTQAPLGSVPGPGEGDITTIGVEIPGLGGKVTSYIITSDDLLSTPIGISQGASLGSVSGFTSGDNTTSVPSAQDLPQTTTNRVTTAEQLISSPAGTAGLLLSSEFSMATLTSATQAILPSIMTESGTANLFTSIQTESSIENVAPNGITSSKISLTLPTETSQTNLPNIGISPPTKNASSEHVESASEGGDNAAQAVNNTLEIFKSSTSPLKKLPQILNEAVAPALNKSEIVITDENDIPVLQDIDVDFNSDSGEGMTKSGFSESGYHEDSNVTQSVTGPTTLENQISNIEVSQGSHTEQESTTYSNLPANTSTSHLLVMRPSTNEDEDDVRTTSPLDDNASVESTTESQLTSTLLEESHSISNPTTTEVGTSESTNTIIEVDLSLAPTEELVTEFSTEYTYVYGNTTLSLYEPETEAPPKAGHHWFHRRKTTATTPAYYIGKTVTSPDEDEDVTTVTTEKNTLPIPSHQKDSKESSYDTSKQITSGETHQEHEHKEWTTIAANISTDSDQTQNQSAITAGSDSEMDVVYDESEIKHHDEHPVNTPTTTLKPIQVTPNLIETSVSETEDVDYIESDDALTNFTKAEAESTSQAEIIYEEISATESISTSDSTTIKYEDVDSTESDQKFNNFTEAEIELTSVTENIPHKIVASEPKGSSGSSPTKSGDVDFTESEFKSSSGSSSTTSHGVDSTESDDKFNNSTEAEIESTSETEIIHNKIASTESKGSSRSSPTKSGDDDFTESEFKSSSSTQSGEVDSTESDNKFNNSGEAEIESTSQTKISLEETITKEFKSSSGSSTIKSAGVDTNVSDDKSHNSTEAEIESTTQPKIIHEEIIATEYKSTFSNSATEAGSTSEKEILNDETTTTEAFTMNTKFNHATSISTISIMSNDTIATEDEEFIATTPKSVISTRFPQILNPHTIMQSSLTFSPTESNDKNLNLVVAQVLQSNLSTPPIIADMIPIPTINEILPIKAEVFQTTLSSEENLTTGQEPNTIQLENQVITEVSIANATSISSDFGEAKESTEEMFSSTSTMTSSLTEQNIVESTTEQRNQEATLESTEAGSSQSNPSTTYELSTTGVTTANSEENVSTDNTTNESIEPSQSIFTNGSTIKITTTKQIEYELPSAPTETTKFFILDENFTATSTPSTLMFILSEEVSSTPALEPIEVPEVLIPSPVDEVKSNTTPLSLENLVKMVGSLSHIIEEIASTHENIPEPTTIPTANTSEQLIELSTTTTSERLTEFSTTESTTSTIESTTSTIESTTLTTESMPSSTTASTSTMNYTEWTTGSTTESVHSTSKDYKQKTRTDSSTLATSTTPFSSPVATDSSSASSVSTSASKHRLHLDLLGKNGTIKNTWNKVINKMKHIGHANVTTNTPSNTSTTQSKMIESTTFVSATALGTETKTTSMGAIGTTVTTEASSVPSTMKSTPRIENATVVITNEFFTFAPIPGIINMSNISELPQNVSFSTTSHMDTTTNSTNISSSTESSSTTLTTSITTESTSSVGTSTTSPESTRNKLLETSPKETSIHTEHGHGPEVTGIVSTVSPLSDHITEISTSRREETIPPKSEEHIEILSTQLPVALGILNVDAMTTMFINLSSVIEMSSETITLPINVKALMEHYNQTMPDLSLGQSTKPMADAITYSTPSTISLPNSDHTQAVSTFAIESSTLQMTPESVSTLQTKTIGNISKELNLSTSGVFEVDQWKKNSTMATTVAHSVSALETTVSAKSSSSLSVEHLTTTSEVQITTPEQNIITKSENNTTSTGPSTIEVGSELSSTLASTSNRESTLKNYTELLKGEENTSLLTTVTKTEHIDSGKTTMGLITKVTESEASTMSGPIAQLDNVVNNGAVNIVTIANLTSKEEHSTKSMTFTDVASITSEHHGLATESVQPSTQGLTTHAVTTLLEELVHTTTKLSINTETQAEVTSSGSKIIVDSTGHNTTIGSENLGSENATPTTIGGTTLSTTSHFLISSSESRTISQEISFHLGTTTEKTPESTEKLKTEDTTTGGSSSGGIESTMLSHETSPNLEMKTETMGSEGATLITMEGTTSGTSHLLSSSSETKTFFPNTSSNLGSTNNIVGPLEVIKTESVSTEGSSSLGDIGTPTFNHNTSPTLGLTTKYTEGINAENVGSETSNHINIGGTTPGTTQLSSTLSEIKTISPETSFNLGTTTKKIARPSETVKTEGVPTESSSFEDIGSTSLNHESSSNLDLISKHSEGTNMENIGSEGLILITMVGTTLGTNQLSSSLPEIKTISPETSFNLGTSTKRIPGPLEIVNTEGVPTEGSSSEDIGSISVNHETSSNFDLMSKHTEGTTMKNMGSEGPILITIGGIVSSTNQLSSSLSEIKTVSPETSFNLGTTTKKIPGPLEIVNTEGVPTEGSSSEDIGSISLNHETSSNFDLISKHTEGTNMKNMGSEGPILITIGGIISGTNQLSSSLSEIKTISPETSFNLGTTTKKTPGPLEIVKTEDVPIEGSSTGVSETTVLNTETSANLSLITKYTEEIITENTGSKDVILATMGGTTSSTSQLSLNLSSEIKIIAQETSLNPEITIESIPITLEITKTESIPAEGRYSGGIEGTTLNHEASDLGIITKYTGEMNTPVGVEGTISGYNVLSKIESESTTPEVKTVHTEIQSEGAIVSDSPSMAANTSYGLSATSDMKSEHKEMSTGGFATEKIYPTEASTEIENISQQTAIDSSIMHTKILELLGGITTQSLATEDTSFIDFQTATLSHSELSSNFATKMNSYSEEVIYELSTRHETKADYTMETEGKTVEGTTSLTIGEESDMLNITTIESPTIETSSAPKINNGTTIEKDILITIQNTSFRNNELSSNPLFEIESVTQQTSHGLSTTSDTKPEHKGEMITESSTVVLDLINTSLNQSQLSLHPSSKIENLSEVLSPKLGVTPEFKQGLMEGLKTEVMESTNFVDLRSTTLSQNEFLLSFETESIVQGTTLEYTQEINSESIGSRTPSLNELLIPLLKLGITPEISPPSEIENISGETSLDLDITPVLNPLEVENISKETLFTKEITPVNGLSPEIEHISTESMLGMSIIPIIIPEHKEEIEIEDTESQSTKDVDRHNETSLPFSGIESISQESTYEPEITLDTFEITTVATTVEAETTDSQITWSSFSKGAISEMYASAGPESGKDKGANEGAFSIAEDMKNNTTATDLAAENNSTTVNNINVVLNFNQTESATDWTPSQFPLNIKLLLQAASKETADVLEGVHTTPMLNFGVTTTNTFLDLKQFTIENEATSARSSATPLADSKKTDSVIPKITTITSPVIETTSTAKINYGTPGEKHVLTTVIVPPVLSEEHKILDMHHFSTKIDHPKVTSTTTDSKFTSLIGLTESESKFPLSVKPSETKQVLEMTSSFAHLTQEDVSYSTSAQTHITAWPMTSSTESEPESILAGVNDHQLTSTMKSHAGAQQESESEATITTSTTEEISYITNARTHVTPLHLTGTEEAETSHSKTHTKVHTEPTTSSQLNTFSDTEHSTQALTTQTLKATATEEQYQTINAGNLTHNTTTTTRTEFEFQFSSTQKSHGINFNLFKHKPITTNPSTRIITTFPPTTTKATEAFYVIGNMTCKYTPVDENQSFNMTPTTTSRIKPVYINLPTYLPNSTWPVPNFRMYYTGRYDEDRSQEDDQPDHTLNPYAFKSMKLADFLNITEFPKLPDFNTTTHISAGTKISQESSGQPSTTESITECTTTTEASTTETSTTSSSTTPTTLTTTTPTTLVTPPSTTSSTTETSTTSTTTSSTTPSTITPSTTVSSTSPSTSTTPKTSTTPSTTTTTPQPTLPIAPVTIANVVPTCSGAASGPEPKVCNIEKDKNSCICSVDSIVKTLQEKARDPNISSALSTMCEVYIPLNTTGIKLGRSTARLRRSMDDYDLDVQVTQKPKREVIAAADIKDTLSKDIELIDSETHKFAMPGSRVRLICADGKNFSSKDYNIHWTLGKIPLTGGKIQESSNGDLVIENVEPSDGGNYTCSVTNHQVARRTFEHELSVITLPKLDINTTILYEVNAECLKEDEDLARVYFATAIGNMLCGKDHPICSVDIVNCTCINKQKKYLSIVLVFHIEDMHVIVPTLNTTQCNVICQVKIYAKLLSVVMNNIIVFETQPVIYKHSRDIILTPSKETSLAPNDITDAPKLIVACPPGYGLWGDKHICLACEKNTYNSGGQSRCTPCPNHYFQPYSGSRSCIKCSTPFQDPACMSMMVLNVKKYKYYAYIALGLCALIVLCVICMRCRKSKKHKKPKHAKRKRNHSPSSVTTDIEMQTQQQDTQEKNTLTQLSVKTKNSRRLRRLKANRAPPIPTSNTGDNQPNATPATRSEAVRAPPPTPPTPDF